MTSNVFPVLRYKDGHAAIDWLGRAFAFETHGVFDGPDGGVAHAELRLGSGVVALSSGVSTPDNPWAHVRQGVYVRVDAVDALHDRAKAAGAEIASPLKDQDYGSREFGARDLAGHLWGFGTYDMSAAGAPNTLVAGLHYGDSRAALAWLERAFGFRTSLEVPGPDGAVMHAEMRLGDGAIMLESGPKDPAVWGENLLAIYGSLADPDAHHARAKAAGAHIIRPPHDTPWGRGYYAHDLEGFIWGFSTYTPAP
jgi:uncharacterized glyoxalase superfamily protein PhnB